MGRQSDHMTLLLDHPLALLLLFLVTLPPVSSLESAGSGAL